MTGDFKITHEHMKALGPCAAGWRDFLSEYPKEQYPDGVGYQDILDRCCEKGRADYAYWLLSKVGPTSDVRVYEEAIDDANKRIVFAGSIAFKASVVCKSIKAGWGIEAGRGIKAGWGIEAGEGIEAGWGIEAGEGIKAGFRIFAGISIYRDSETCEKHIRCKKLISGEVAYGDLEIIKEE